MRRALLWTVLLTAFVVTVAPASATKVKLGKVAPSGAFPGSCSDCEAFAVQTDPASPSYVVPTGRWTIISWRAQGDPVGDAHARLRIYRPGDVSGRYKLVAQSHSELVPGGTKPGHDARIRVRGGDLLGIESIGVMPIVYETGLVADEFAQPTCEPQVGDSVGAGTACSLITSTGRRVNAAATLKSRG
jgi:hypothetical protein